MASPVLDMVSGLLLREVAEASVAKEKMLRDKRFCLHWGRAGGELRSAGGELPAGEEEKRERDNRFDFGVGRSEESAVEEGKIDFRRRFSLIRLTFGCSGTRMEGRGG